MLCGGMGVWEGFFLPYTHTPTLPYHTYARLSRTFFYFVGRLRLVSLACMSCADLEREGDTSPRIGVRGRLRRLTK